MLIVRMVPVAAALCAVLAASACASRPGAAADPAPGPSVGQRLDRTVPSAIANASLINSAGQPVTLASLRGRVVVVSDMLTLCQGTCPLDTANVAAAARRVSAAGLGKRVAFLSITVDPGRDTPQRLAAYRRQYSPAAADWQTVTGSSQTINDVWKWLGVYRQRVPDKRPGPRDWLTGHRLTYDVTHSDEVFFFDATGRERFLLEGAPHVSPGITIPPKLKAFLARSHESNADPGPESWTEPDELQVLSWLLNHNI
jgi:cytochrome oxidase Cu insertion factor (SCO1/SenC/PrrC family)